MHIAHLLQIIRGKMRESKLKEKKIGKLELGYSFLFLYLAKIYQYKELLYF